MNEDAIEFFLDSVRITDAGAHSHFRSSCYLSDGDKQLCAELVEAGLIKACSGRYIYTQRGIDLLKMMSI